MKAELNRKVKYKGEYYNANTPFAIPNEDIEDFKLMGATFHEDAEENALTLYLDTPKDKLKTLVDLVEDEFLLKDLIEKDKRKFAKELYTKRLEEILTAKEGDKGVN